MRRAEARVARIAARIAAIDWPEGVTATVQADGVHITGRALRERAVTDPAFTAIGWRAMR